MTTLDLNILPIHRLNGQDLADLPGLLALLPPRKTARGREKDSLILYLMLAGNATFADSEVDTLIRKAATTFYQSAGTLTSAMRKAAESLNTDLLERNLATTGRGQYALGLLALAVVRESLCTLLLSGPTHAVWVGEGQARHIHDPALSGKGLGSSQSVQSYFAQVDLHAEDLLVLCGRFPRDWEADLLGERPHTSLEASYRKLTFTKGDLNPCRPHPHPKGTGRHHPPPCRSGSAASDPADACSCTYIWGEFFNNTNYQDQFITAKENEHEILDYKFALLGGTKNDNTDTELGTFWRLGAAINAGFFILGMKYKPDFSEGINNFHIPVLFFYSELSMAYPDEWATKITSVYNDVEIYKVPGTGHSGIISSKKTWQETTLPRLLS